MEREREEERPEPVLVHVLGPDQLLWAPDNPNGVHLEDLLEQLVDELRHQTQPPTREGALVITKLEEAILWRRRDLERQGRAKWGRVRTPPAAEALERDG